MYNRYIPQSDGSYRRSRVPEPQSPPRNHRPCPPPEPQQPAPVPCPPPERPCAPEPACPPPVHKGRPCAGKQDGSALGFLKQLLPKNFDTGDLLVVLLLLIMAGDCADDQNSALLTLALYLFL